MNSLLSMVLLGIWAGLAIFYLTSFLAALFGRPLKVRFVAPSLLGNLAMAICFTAFLASRWLQVQDPERSQVFGYVGFGALFLALVLDVLRRAKTSPRGDEGSR